MYVFIRPAMPSDAETLTYLALAGKRYWNYPEVWLEAWREFLTITPDYVKENIVACAEDGAGQVIGFYAIERDGVNFRLGNLFVMPFRIGHGLGKRMFEHAVQTAQSLGGVEMLIEADPNAEGFYLRMGATRIGELVSNLLDVKRVVPLLRYPLRSITEA